MTEWVDINGAKVEISFFKENIQEARRYVWTKVADNELSNHVHCMTCNIAIDSKNVRDLGLYQSECGYACGYCYDNFICSRQKKVSVFKNNREESEKGAESKKGTRVD